MPRNCIALQGLLKKSIFLRSSANVKVISRSRRTVRTSILVTIVTLKHEGSSGHSVFRTKNTPLDAWEREQSRYIWNLQPEVGIRGQDGGHYVMYRGVESETHHPSQQMCTFYSHVLRNIVAAICEESRIAGLRYEKKLSSGWSFILCHIFALDLLCTLLSLCKR